MTPCVGPTVLSFGFFLRAVPFPQVCLCTSAPKKPKKCVLRAHTNGSATSRPHVASHDVHRARGFRLRSDSASIVLVMPETWEEEERSASIATSAEGVPLGSRATWDDEDAIVVHPVNGLRVVLSDDADARRSDLVEAVLAAFVDMGATRETILGERCRLDHDPAYFFEHVACLPDWSTHGVYVTPPTACENDRSATP